MNKRINKSICIFLLCSFFVFTIVSCDIFKNKKINIDISTLSSEILPGDNFYDFVNGKWAEEECTPNCENLFYSLEKANLMKIKDDFEDIEDITSTSPLKKQLRQIYYAGIDTRQIERAGTKHLFPYFYLINAIETKEDFARVLAALHSEQIFTFFKPEAALDYYKQDTCRLYFIPSLPATKSKGVYFNDSLREQYRELIKKSLLMAEIDGPAAEKVVKSVIDIEKKLAYSIYRTEPINTKPGRYTADETEEIFSSFLLDVYFEELEIDEAKIYFVNTKKYFKTLNYIFQSTSISQIKDYLYWSVLQSYARYLNSELQNMHAEYYEDPIVDMKLYHWQKILMEMGRLAPMEFNKYYRQEFGDVENDSVVEEMSTFLLSALEEMVKENDWMGDATKDEALMKLEAIQINTMGLAENFMLQEIIGITYFDFVRSCKKNYFITEMNYLGSTQQFSHFPGLNYAARIWYSPHKNTLFIPDGILQTPIYQKDMSEPVSYGALGTIIASGMLQSINLKGRLITKENVYYNWWSKEDVRSYNNKVKSACPRILKYELTDTTDILSNEVLNDYFTLNGSLDNAYDAWVLAREAGKASKKRVSRKYTNDQLFFISFATTYRTGNYDVNPVDKNIVRARLNYYISNNNYFYDAFQVEEINYLFVSPERRENIWQ